MMRLELDADIGMSPEQLQVATIGMEACVVRAPVYPNVYQIW